MCIYICIYIDIYIIIYTYIYIYICGNTCLLWGSVCICMYPRTPPDEKAIKCCRAKCVLHFRHEPLRVKEMEELGFNYSIYFDWVHFLIGFNNV